MWDLKETKNFIFIIMEFLEGGELFEQIITEKYFSLEKSFCFFIQILRGL